jgi:serpin B
MRTHLLLAASVSLVAACSVTTSHDPGPTPDGPVAQSTLARNTQPTVSGADALELRAGDTAFAADLYQTLAKDPAFSGKNMFFSPHSISTALAMTYAGARGNTASQMAGALHFTLPQDRLHPALDALDLSLSSRGQGAKGDDGKAFRLRVTNSLWGAPQIPFAEPFLDTLATSYGAGVRLTDFQKDPEAARHTINGWVDGQTEDRIKELLGPGTIQQDTRLVLVNAIYFNAAWATPFDPKATRPATFHGAAGDVDAQMMSEGGELAYAEGQGWQAVSLPYDGKELSLIAVLPQDLASFEAGFAGAQAESIVSSMRTAAVNLSLPKFKIEGSSVSLKTALAARGMTDAFTPGVADFSGMTTAESLSISDVIHQAFVSVDEAGTEAAAATAVIMTGSAAPTKVVDVTFDRPFVFFVRDDATGAVLFLGRVTSP